MGEATYATPFDDGDVFCANPACVLHVRSGDDGVEGSGQWAVIDGVTYDRHPLEAGGRCYCSACRRRMLADALRPMAPARSQDSVA
jgi:hypothetical protein